MYLFWGYSVHTFGREVSGGSSTCEAHFDTIPAAPSPVFVPAMSSPAVERRKAIYAARNFVKLGEGEPHWPMGAIVGASMDLLRWPRVLFDWGMLGGDDGGKPKP